MQVKRGADVEEEKSKPAWLAGLGEVAGCIEVKQTTGRLTTRRGKNQRVDRARFTLQLPWKDRDSRWWASCRGG